MKRSRPIIKLKIQCYHFETHHWWELAVKDQRARAIVRSKEVRVNTHAASHAYQYYPGHSVANRGSYVDDSAAEICARNNAYNRWPATLLPKVEFGKRGSFGDDYTRQHFGCTSGASSGTTGGTHTTTFRQHFASPSSGSGF